MVFKIRVVRHPYKKDPKRDPNLENYPYPKPKTSCKPPETPGPFPGCSKVDTALVKALLGDWWVVISRVYKHNNCSYGLC